jgi:hypothetical protein
MAYMWNGMYGAYSNLITIFNDVEQGVIRGSKLFCVYPVNLSNNDHMDLAAIRVCGPHALLRRSSICTDDMVDTV